jgi:hypothetical protein
MLIAPGHLVLWVITGHGHLLQGIGHLLSPVSLRNWDDDPLGHLTFAMLLYEIHYLVANRPTLSLVWGHRSGYPPLRSGLGGWPLKETSPMGDNGDSFIIVMAVSILIWNFLTNLDGTPLADTPINHKGPLNVEWLTGYLVWAIAWFFVFSPVFTTQGWPFGKWGQPGAAIGQTILAHILGFIFWRGSLGLGLSPTFSFAAAGSSLIFWSLVYCWHLQFWGVTKFTFFKRALSAFIVQVIIIAIWILIIRAILGPAGKAVLDAKLPADVNILIIYLNLCIVGPALIAHNAFWLRWPLTLPNPPGTPPPDQAA